jgi:DivIVA domain-containing protein
VVDGESSNEQEKLSPVAPEQEHRFSELRHYVPADLLDVSFPLSVRGYERRAVDAYIKRVNRVVAEFKVRSSPPAAVRHALEQAGEKVQGLLQAARDAAEEMTASVRLEAEESTARAKAEAAKLVVNTSAEADRVKAEAAELIANARAEADDAVAKAKAEAGGILAEAKVEAQDSGARVSVGARVVIGRWLAAGETGRFSTLARSVRLVVAGQARPAPIERVPMQRRSERQRAAAGVAVRSSAIT